jgi:deoxyadenosine/deoxycytidine kinase
MCYIFTLEGNIGVGKSSLLAILERELGQIQSTDVIFEYEPVDDWLNTHAPGNAKSIFEMYYDDKVRYGFVFQMFAMQTRFEHLSKIIQANPGKIIICERTPITDREIFAKMMHDQGIITSTEFMVYESWYNFITHIIQPRIAGTIYMRAEPSTSIKRIIKRGRIGEGSIEIDYVNNLYKQHEKWLTDNGHIKNSDAIITLNCDADGNDGHVGAIREFINRRTMAAAVTMAVAETMTENGTVDGTGL